MTDAYKVEIRSERFYTWASYSILAILGLFHFWLCTQYPLHPDECYYWLWSKHLDWSYYSKGPLVAWTIWLSTLLAGDTELGVRWPAVALHLGTGTLLFYFCKKYLTAHIGFWAVITVSCIPLFAVGSILMTIDPLSVFFWAMAVVTGWHAYQTGKWFPWLLTGLWIGIGFLAKFTNAIQGICFGLFLFLTPQGRTQLKTPWPWLAAFIALILTTPFWIWNSQHDWITFNHLQHRGSLDRPFRISINEFFQFTYMQALVFSPLIWIGMMAATFSELKRWMRDRTRFNFYSNPLHLYLLSQFLPLLVFFAIFALNDSGQPNWTVPGYFTVIILSVIIWLSWTNQKQMLKWFAIVALVLGLIMTIIFHDTRWLNLEPKRDPLNKIRGWKQIGEIVENTRREQNATFVIANHYQVASALTWHMPVNRQENMIFIPHNPEMIQNQFDFWKGYQDFVGQNAIFVTTQKGTPRTLREEFQSVTPLTDPFWVHENGRPVERFRLFICINYLGRKTVTSKDKSFIEKEPNF